MDEIPVYIINLEHRTERKEQILKELEKNYINNFKFIKAIPGNTLNLEELLKNGTVNFNKIKMNRNEIGCYMSHLSILESILDSDQELHLILEDDAFFEMNFKNRMNKALNKIKNYEWDVLFAGVNVYDITSYDGKYIGEKCDGIYYPDNILPGTHGYVIKKSAVQKIIQEMRTIDYPYDLKVMIHTKKLVLRNTLIKTSNLYSDTLNE